MFLSMYQFTIYIQTYLGARLTCSTTQAASTTHLTQKPLDAVKYKLYFEYSPLLFQTLSGGLQAGWWLPADTCCEAHNYAGAQ